MDSYSTAIVATIVFTIILLIIYKLIVNPQMVIVASKAKCPDLWAYNEKEKVCEPQYKTSCSSFDPKSPSLHTATAKCTLAHRCGSTWAGYCP
uniref:CPW-WPC domain-containing protein n=1 Tax=viral metagenome TaxID=1070528 RepID=A0A6C0AIM5_9ZZZZ